MLELSRTPIPVSPSNPPLRVRPDPDEPLKVLLLNDDRSDAFEARDVSVTGIGIFAPHRFAGWDLDRQVRLIVLLPNCQPFLARARIVHASHREREFFGLEFVDLHENKRREIEQYVQRLTKKEMVP